MGQSGQEDKKKIKTESGQYISSSYKRDLYPKGQTEIRWGRVGLLTAATPIEGACVGAGLGDFPSNLL